MPVNIKDEDRKRLLRKRRVLRFLEDQVWATLPAEERGRRLSREEEDAILGYGSEGA